MAKEYSIINILTSRLPYVLANQIFNEFQSRLSEAKILIEKYKAYSDLQSDIKTIELLLSLSIFHRRVIANFDGAVKFYTTVNRIGKAETIKMGSYDLTWEERNKLLAVIMSYNKLLEKYAIPIAVLEYYETREFLRKIVVYKSNLEDAEYKNQRKGKSKDINEDELPF